MNSETVVGSILKHGLRSKYLDWLTKSPGLTNLYKSATGSGLTDSQKEANAFTAQQAQKQMDFQQQMRDTQYQSAVADMKSAGINPALMYGNGSSGNSAPSGAMASSAQPSQPDVVGLLGQIANLSLLKGQARLLNSQANKTDQDVEESKERVNQIRANTSNLLANIDLIRANVRKSLADSGLAEVALKYANEEHELGLQISRQSAKQIEQNIRESIERCGKISAEKQTELQKLVNMKQEYNLLVLQQDLTGQQIEQMKHLIGQIDATTNNLIASTGLTRQDIQYYEWNHTKEVAPTKGHIDSKGNTITFGSSKGVSSLRRSFKSKYSAFKKAVKPANDLRY